MTTQTHPSESQHWYTRDGQPMYTIVGKNGVERNTTLRDARKLDLLPSVTMIINEAAKFGLENWKQEQVLWAALTCPEYDPDNETDQEYIARIIADSKEQSIKAAERGKQIHAWIQQGFEFEELEGDADKYFVSVWDEIKEHIDIGFWKCETPFATDRYGGKSDIRIINGYQDLNTECILDIKTKDKPLDDNTVKIWDNHVMQLAAYREGLHLPNAQCGIVFVSTVDISARLVWIPEDELQKGLNMFNALLDYYYAKTGL